MSGCVTESSPRREDIRWRSSKSRTRWATQRGRPGSQRPRRRCRGSSADYYMHRLRALPEPVQRLMVLAAADPTGSAPLLWRAVQILGVGRDAAAVAESEGLLHIGVGVRFRHPLVRSTAYAAATPEDRRAAHLALAAATDQERDPERRVWHLAAAATGPDEDLAMELERMASTARARGGLAAAAAFLERSSALTAEPTARRAGRALGRGPRPCPGRRHGGRARLAGRERRFRHR